MITRETPDFSKFSTNITYLKYCLHYVDRTLWSYFKFSLRLIFLISGTVAFTVYNFKFYGEVENLVIMENSHWVLTYISVINWDIQMAKHSLVFLSMSQTIKKGVYQYGIYSITSVKKLNEANDWVKKVTRFFTAAYTLAVLVTLAKSTILTKGDGRYQPFFNMWFPFDINSTLRVNLVRLYQLGCGFCAASGGLTFYVTFIAIATHLEAQMEVLIEKLEELLDWPRKSSTFDERLKDCHAHHQAILRTFNEFSTFVSTNLGIAAILSTMMLCTLGYLLTSPQLDIALIVTFSGVVIPEFCLLTSFRTHGQTITDLSIEINRTLYGLPWWNENIKIQKIILMWLRLTSKPLELTSAGLKNVSHEGIKELLQTSYTYFNMLKASA